MALDRPWSFEASRAARSGGSFTLWFSKRRWNSMKHLGSHAFLAYFKWSPTRSPQRPGATKRCNSEMASAPSQPAIISYRFG